MDDTREVIGTVVVVIPEFHQAHLRTEDGWLYAFTRRTPGIALDSVQEGQRYRCTVTTSFARVLSAELILS